jgi:acetyltransferase-like isoleucine patch superfamily enzyme
MQGDETTLRPFGKAFYLRKAPYFVLPLSFIVLFTFITKIFVSLFHMLPLLGAIQGAGVILYGLPISHRHYARYHYTHADVFGRMLMVFMALHVFRVLCWLAIDLTSKWTLMGRRKEGVYNYDQVPYAQKWEIYQIIGKIRKFGRVNFLDFLAGTPFMSTYFRLNGCRIGKDCCLYPAGGDPYMPEPDLVTMGDRCVIDCASIVCHLNTRGNFELTRIVLANDTTLRARGRVQAGVHVEAGAMLLEKSLAMTGEVVEARSVWQGGPASWWFQYPESNKDYQTETDDSSESSNENDANSETARLIQSSSKASMCYESV